MPQPRGGPSVPVAPLGTVRQPLCVLPSVDTTGPPCLRTQAWPSGRHPTHGARIAGSSATVFP
jgi:hypothetical protein